MFTCDVCPTSNLRLGVSPSIERHPLRRMIDAAVPVTLGADNPIDFGVTCGGEYARVRDAFGLSDPRLAAIAETSARASGASQATKTRITEVIQRRPPLCLPPPRPAFANYVLSWRASMSKRASRPRRRGSSIQRVTRMVSTGGSSSRSPAMAIPRVACRYPMVKSSRLG